MRTLIFVAALCAASVHAEDVVIPEALVQQCAENGGCVVVLPSGQIFPLEVVRQQIAQVARNAYAAGKEEGEQNAVKACKRKDV